MRHVSLFAICVYVVVTLVFTAGAAAPVSPASNGDHRPATILVSTGLNGAPTTDHSFHPSISSDGRYVVYSSTAANLAPNDTYGSSDVFIYDRQTGKNSLVSMNSQGVKGDGFSAAGMISANGRYVVFHSNSKNFGAGNSPNQDVYVRDLRKGLTSRVTNAVGGGSSNGDSNSWSISGDGRFVAFSSTATNLVADGTNSNWNIFLYDRQTGTIRLASVASDGSQSDGFSMEPVVSDNGRWVAFWSGADNLAPNDTNGIYDVFVHDFKTGLTQRASLASDGTQANNGSDRFSMSADGRYIVFQSYASNLVRKDTNNSRDIFLHDMKTGKTTRINVSKTGSQANGDSSMPSISPDGEYVTFISNADNLVPSDKKNIGEVFIKSLKSGDIRLISRASNGALGKGEPIESRVSNDGDWVTFSSADTNLAPNDTNGFVDIFLVGPRE